MVDEFFAPRYSHPTCIACRKSIDLGSETTFMCTRCKSYFCSECADYHLNLQDHLSHPCPGSSKNMAEEHSPVIAKITRTIKENGKTGVKIGDLERKSKKPSRGVKVVDQSIPKKPTVRILDENESKTLHNKEKD